MRGDRITAVGPADTIAVPDGATIIDATGKTIMPGMWDMHGHMQADEPEHPADRCSSPYGITTVRDLGSDPDVAVANRERANAGKIAGPRAILSASSMARQQWAGADAEHRPHRSRSAQSRRALRLARLQADQALQPRASRSRADVRRRSAQARHATERAHSARAAACAARSSSGSTK